MRHRALVISHADADGHLIAEQVRRNLALIDSFDVDVVINPAITKDHKVWLRLEEIKEIASANYVFFVDLMFGPTSYSEEAKALTSFVHDCPDKRFFLIDHHPLPLRRLGEADNLRVVYRPDVFECAIGPRSGMMVVAAICEHQEKEVADVRTPLHETLARGVKRAAALGGPLPGDKLLALLKADHWDDLVQLGDDDPKYHYLPRGRRPMGSPKSNALKELDKAATELLAHRGRNAGKSKHVRRGRADMAYDTDVGQEQLTYDSGRLTLQRNTAASPKDLGVIVTLLEVAALSLATSPGTTFTFEQLVREARDIGGKDLDLDERDIKIVLQKARFLQKVGKEYSLR